MTTKRVCKHCNKEIDLKKDKHSMIGTYTGDQVDDETYFHFKCFVEWYNKKVSEKAKNTTSKMQEKVQGLIANPQISGMLNSIGGIDKIKGMLNTNLVGDNEELKNLFNVEEKPKKNQDGKRKTKPKAKPKAKVQ